MMRCIKWFTGYVGRITGLRKKMTLQIHMKLVGSPRYLDRANYIFKQIWITGSDPGNVSLIFSILQPPGRAVPSPTTPGFDLGNIYREEAFRLWFDLCSLIGSWKQLEIKQKSALVEQLHHQRWIIWSVAIMEHDNHGGPACSGS